ncbi:DUF305 domain-containing protein [Nocardia sp. NPDC005366]|uniref:DUF305 domain-containing protein n=1 Tax=Nocardia sp. NPDC005366 TaxID=3156878 RepID=UPI0033BC6292
MRTRRWHTPVALVVAAGVCVAAGVLIGWFGRGEPETGATPILADADIVFAQQMSAHHQQAITMVDMLGSGATPDVRAVAEQIRASQWREIGTLTGWLELTGMPVQQPGAPDSSGDHHGHAAGMPGMASNEELTRLYHATGDERDVLFLQLMIRHHQGGVAMAAAAAEVTAVPAVRARAISIVNGQQQEITLMTVSLDKRGGSALPYP